MNRRTFLSAGAITIGAVSIPFFALSKEQENSFDKWRSRLSREQFSILFEEQTERSYSSPLLTENRKGTFICAACFQPLFSSATKYKSGTGWPSFWQPLEGAVNTKRDFKLWLPRTEYHCSNCQGHQGHVFDDGPQPTGQRYCNNGLALEFIVDGDNLPAIRG